MGRLLVLGGGLLLALQTSSAAAQTAPVTLEDYFNLASVSGPDFSPDSGRIVYSVSQADKDRDEETSDLWEVPWKGAQPRQLTRTPEASEWQPHYAADGKTLFFLSDADGPDGEGDVQLWSMPAKGGRARRVTAIPGGISD